MSLTKIFNSSASIIIIHFVVRLHLIVCSTLLTKTFIISRILNSNFYCLLFFVLLLIKRWSLLDGFRHIGLNWFRQRYFFLDWLGKRCFFDNHKLRCFFFDWLRQRLFLEWFRQRCFFDVHKFRGFLFDRLRCRNIEDGLRNNLLFLLSPLLSEMLL